MKLKPRPCEFCKDKNLADHLVIEQTTISCPANGSNLRFHYSCSECAKKEPDMAKSTKTSRGILIVHLVNQTAGKIIYGNLEGFLEDN